MLKIIIYPGVSFSHAEAIVNRWRKKWSGQAVPQGIQNCLCFHAENDSKTHVIAYQTKAAIIVRPSQPPTEDMP